MCTAAWEPDQLNPELLHRALAHRSWCAENPGEASNERLEFLGDAVLGVVVTDYLFTTYPDRPEGWLSPARSSLVRGGTLADVARELDLGERLLLGRGEESSGGREKPSILADALEAVIGAVYIDGGLEEARGFIHSVMADRMARIGELAEPSELTSPEDHKSRFQELCARQSLGSPEYTWTESGPEHAKDFIAEVSIDGKVVGRGNGRSKKLAEQQAALIALATIVPVSEPE